MTFIQSVSSALSALASTFTYLMASVIDFAPYAPPFNEEFSGSSLPNELGQYRSRAPSHAFDKSLSAVIYWLIVYCHLPDYGF
ncbi:unnamed protein product [Linum trigynum]|uniref:Uncharacterized protein n=1 Tax=Linum trigynum TaxID=586398 RepID=A0AAV2DGB0_9ROSI